MTTRFTCEPLVLASASAARAALLCGAGLDIEIKPATIDEPSIRAALGAGDRSLKPADIAMLLAHAKALDVSEKSAGRLVIGADQVLVCEGIRFDKPGTRDEARDQLIKLRGKRHELITAVVCARGGEILWSHEDVAALVMRDFSNEFLGGYLAAMGDEVLSSVGGYKLEGLGAQLFEHIEGDYFSILGLPLLALLSFLRGADALGG